MVYNHENYNDVLAFLNNIRLKIINFGYLKTDSRWQHYNVKSSYSRLYIIKQGTGRIYNQKEKLLLNEKHVVIIPSDTICSYICDTHLEKYYFHFRAELYGQDLLEKSPVLYSSLPGDSSFNSLVDIARKAVSNHVKPILSLNALLLNIIANYVEFAGIALPRRNAFLSNVFAYINDNISLNLTVSDLARKFSGPELSLSAFSKRFTREAGMAPKNYINKILIRKAQDLLLTGDETIRSVAEKLKFDNPCYFSRFFKKQTGISPGAYRQVNSFLSKQV